MILDSLKNTARWEVLHPLFKQAFDFLKKTDFSTITDGKYELNGDQLFVNVVSLAGKDKKEALVETHQKYIDIQMPVAGVEKIGWKGADQLQELYAPYNEEQDIAFFLDRPTAYTKVYPRQFVVYFPEDGHAPGIGHGAIRKAIVKVAIGDSFSTAVYPPTVVSNP